MAVGQGSQGEMGEGGGSERLSALDATFLEVETRESPMGIGAVCIFDAGTMLRSDGSFDVSRLRAHVDRAIASLPRYRQRIVHTPLIGQPVWIDDTNFNLDFHLRYTRLPAPGDNRQLQRLAARLFSQPIDRDHPLWELWCVEGLTHHRFAIIGKVHHCMADGAAGVGLLTALLQSTPTVSTPPPPPPWQPQATPQAVALLRNEIAHRNHQTFGMVRTLARAMTQAVAGPARTPLASAPAPAHKRNAAGTRPAQAVANGIYDILRAALHRRTRTPLTPDRIGGARRFDIARVSLADVKAIAAQLGGTVNDVVLTLVAGVLREFLAQRGMNPTTIGALRAMIPVNLRAPGSDQGGNQLAMLLTELPIHEGDPRVRHRLVREATERLKHQSDQIAASAFVTSIADAAATGVLSKIFHAAVRLRSFDVVVTNVRGPSATLFVGDAPMLALYPMVPLYERQAIGVAVFSYAGTLHIGLSAAWDLVPDLHDVALQFERSLDELRTASSVAEG